MSVEIPKGAVVAIDPHAESPFGGAVGVAVEQSHSPELVDVEFFAWEKPVTFTRDQVKIVGYLPEWEPANLSVAPSIKAKTVACKGLTDRKPAG